MFKFTHIFFQNLNNIRKIKKYLFSGYSMEVKSFTTFATFDFNYDVIHNLTSLYV